tara:strand:- start:20435 stop:20632 length:198 start_codon:yes stop_codon:yes gene_type:complete
MLQIASTSSVALKKKAGFSAYSTGFTENNQSPVVTASAVPAAEALLKMLDAADLTSAKTWGQRRH